MESIKYSLTDLVMGMFGFGKEETEKIPRKKIYSTLYEMSKKEEFKEIFRDFYFSQLPLDSGVYSKKVEEILFMMGVSGLATENSPRFDTIEISAKAKLSIQDYVKRFHPGHIDTMKVLAEEFNRILYS